jgi:hypothetical protein
MRFAHWLILSAYLLACGSELAPGAAPSHGEVAEAEVGRAGVRLRLDGASNDGRRFRLARATLELSGAASVVLRAPRDSEDGTLSAPLPGGTYATSLRPGFVLVEKLADGSERNVEATLDMAQPLLTRVPEAEPAFLSLVFHVGEATVEIGGGSPLRLSVRR